MDKYIEAMLAEVNKASQENEIPVGAVIVKNNKIIAKAHNQKESSNCALYHAELIAIKKANKHEKDWRLEGSTMFVSLEPCAMCMGAIVEARISLIVCLAENKKWHNVNCKILEESNTILEMVKDNYDYGKNIKSFFENIRTN